MPYKTILAYFSSEERAKDLVSAAAQVTRDHTAHLIGVYVVPKIWINPAISMEVPADFLSSQRQYYLEAAKQIEEIFNSEVSGTGISAEWRTLHSQEPKIAPVMVPLARTVDLVILGQPNDVTETDYSAEVPVAVLMGSGRPVLVIPYEKQVKDIGDNVTLAWNGAREATRAAFDALPFLQNAKEVRLLSVDRENKQDSVFGRELAEALSRHGVTVTVTNSSKGNASIGEQLLEETIANRGDLLVIGGYGHSRSREFIFGGATKYILENMVVPVIFSH
ncbi:universal stress protein [uncultured Sneathiella sp.]|uniref:universal stress protein n=1 Tax=uncultured Sneathiella sp. TaxID=879315 RepID=UPI0025955A63|nr:universal stress protein [uncultured Sneathiella sp.]